ncbi:MAG: bile acid:sodium symporter family protein [Pseudomonadota bacterium]|nr:bile acid:sodium symporter family protein [Pseudomonadota bacterium]
MILSDLLYTVAIPLALITVMLGMGLSLTVTDLKRVIVFPKAVATGLVGQLFLLPALAFLLSAILAPSPVIAAGAIMLAACPGGVTSNAYTFAARADVALSVTLTAIESVITIFTIPLFAYFALNYYLDQGSAPDVPAGAMIRQLAMITIIPISCGMVFRGFRPELAARLVELLRTVTLYVLIVLIVTAAAASWEVVLENFVQAGLLVLTLNLLSMGMGYALGRVSGLSAAQQVTLVYEVGVQNISLALLVTLTLLESPPLAIVSLLYAVIMPITALGFLKVASRLRRHD